MTKFDLILELTYSINHLLQSGINCHSLHETHRMMEYSFDRFEEFDGTESSDMELFLDGIAIKLLEMPQELRDYYRVIDTYKAENEIYLCELPRHVANQTVEEVQLMVGLFTILDELLEIGMNSCTIHEARMKIDALFSDFEPEEEHEKELIEDMVLDALDLYFPNMKAELNALTITITSEVDSDAVI